jgi:hypothetical protein
VEYLEERALLSTTVIPVPQGDDSSPISVFLNNQGVVAAAASNSTAQTTDIFTWSKASGLATIATGLQGDGVDPAPGVLAQNNFGQVVYSDGTGNAEFWTPGQQPVEVAVPSGDSPPLSSVFLNDQGVVAAAAQNPVTLAWDIFAWSPLFGTTLIANALQPDGINPAPGVLGENSQGQIAYADGIGNDYLWSPGQQTAGDLIPVPAGDNAPPGTVFLNNQGMIAASATNPNTQATDIFTWTQAGGITNVATGLQTGIAFPGVLAANNQGQVVYMDGNGTAYFWQSGSLPVTIPVPSGDSPAASGVNFNDAGVVAAGAANLLTQSTDLFAWNQTSGLGTIARGLQGGTPTPAVLDENGSGQVVYGDGTGAVDFWTPAPDITSEPTTTFTAGQFASFTIEAPGFPPPTISDGGATVPGGVTFTDNGDGTATLAGAPNFGTGANYSVTITAHNGAGADATQSFTLTVDEAPAITSLNSVTFTVGVAGNFTVTSTGFPVPMIDDGGAILPGGVSFTDNGNGTATLAGTPALHTAGDYPMLITADNSDGMPATQNFTLTVANPTLSVPNIFSANSTSFTIGSAGSFTVQATGTPTPSLSESGALPKGVTFTDNQDGTATIAGTPAAKTGGTYALLLSATNSVGTGTQQFTLTVVGAPAITTANHTTFVVSQTNSFTVKTTGFPVPSLGETGLLPLGVSFVDRGDGTATVSGLPQTVGNYPFRITAHNGIGSDATQAFTLTVGQAPAITSAGSTTFTAGSNQSFTVNTTGFPTPSLSETGALPAGVSFTDNHDGTATLGGIPSAGSGKVYTFTIDAGNGVDPDATQTFTLTVNEAPTITSPAQATFSVAVPMTFTVQAIGYPTPTLSDGNFALPGGLSFIDNGDGTATLAGTPAATTGGSYSFTLTAHNGIGSDGTQSFTLNIDEAVTITSSPSTTMPIGQADAFTVKTLGFPRPTITATGLPAATKLTFTDKGDGTATITGSPAPSTGVYVLTLTASNPLGSAVTQTFLLTINAPPSFTSGNTATFAVGQTGSFAITTKPNPILALATTITEHGTLPTGITFGTGPAGTARLKGKPAAGTAGTYTITLTAGNNSQSTVVQTFTLVVGQPVVTGNAAATFVEGRPGSITLTTTGLSAPSLSETGAPAGITLVDHGDGTASLQGTAAAGTAQTTPYAVTILAKSNGATVNTETLQLNVDRPPTITSPANASFTVGTKGSFAITASPGVPAKTTLAISGALPKGVTFSAKTGMLSGTPAKGSGGTYTFTITASNALTSTQSQAFTLTVVSTDATGSLFVGRAGQLTVTAKGFAPGTTVSESGRLPTGVSFHSNGDGTATFSGTPVAGTASSYPVTLADNGVSKAFTLLVNQSPVFTSSATPDPFQAGSPVAFTIQTVGTPNARLAMVGKLPAGVHFKDNHNGTATLSGAPAKTSPGIYTVIISATNGSLPPAYQLLTLVVNA